MAVSARWPVMVACGALTAVVMSGCSGESVGDAAVTGAVSADGGPYDEQLARAAEQFGITDPPSVPVVREITTDESKRVHNECLVDSGWPQNPDGSFDIADGQRQAMDLAFYRCLAAYPVREAYLQPLTQRQTTMLYQHYRNEYTPCVARYGLTVSEPPSLDVFVADMSSWQPAADVEAGVINLIRDGTFASYDDFSETCPVKPPDDVLFGTGE